MIVTDKSSPRGATFRRLDENKLYTTTEHHTFKHCNKLFLSLRTDTDMIKGMYTI